MWQAIAILVIVVTLIGMCSGGSDESETESAILESTAVSTADSNVAENEPELENTIGSRTYTVAEEKDSSFGNARSRVILEIEADGVTTERAQIETMMKAAVERHRQDWPDAISARLWRDYEADSVIANSIGYAADGCGWTGDDCAGEIWSDVFWGEIPDDLLAWGTPTEDELDASEDLRCRQSLQCWGDRHSLRATFACEPLIESMARFDHEWTDGFLGAKFDRFRWLDREQGYVSYLGDQIKFQNGFGAWQNATYRCDYDPVSEAVLDTEVF